MEKSIVYLAVPYSHSNDAIVEHRYRFVNKVAAKLFSDGEMVFSPISYLHALAKENELPTTWEFWQRVLETFLSLSKKLYVVKMDGWLTSTGVQAEIDFTKKNNILIVYLDPKNFI